MKHDRCECGFLKFQSFPAFPLGLVTMPPHLCSNVDLIAQCPGIIFKKDSSHRFIVLGL